MGYIKINLRSRRTDETGKALTTTISRFESDMPMLDTYEMNLIWHALAIKGKVEMTSVFLLDKSYMDNELYILD